MVDFIDIAESSRFVIDRFLRESDDDFVNLETNVGSSPLSQETKTQPANGNFLNALVNEESYMVTSTRPFLSKSAEAELYLLATNFLVRCHRRLRRRRRRCFL